MFNLEMKMVIDCKKKPNEAYITLKNWCNSPQITSDL